MLRVAPGGSPKSPEIDSKESNATVQAGDTSRQAEQETQVCMWVTRSRDHGSSSRQAFAVTGLCIPWLRANPCSC